MTERDKIIDIVERSRTCGINNSCYECKYNKELENYKDMLCSPLRTADALLENGIGDVAEWKKRAEVAEKKYNIALVGYAKCHRKITHYNKMTTTYDREITQQAEREIEEERK